MNKQQSMSKVFLLFVVLFSCFSTSNASVVGGVVTSSNCAPACTFQLLDPPPLQVGSDNQNDQHLFAFNEMQNVLLTEDLILDSTTIGAGTTVSSHYVFFDPVAVRNLSGSVTFDATILGVASTVENMTSSDDILGSPATTYNSPGLRGLEAGDDYSFTGNTLNLDFSASTPGDYIRVITVSSVPVPAAAWLYGQGLSGLIGMDCHKKDNKRFVWQV